MAVAVAEKCAVVKQLWFLAPSLVSLYFVSNILFHIDGTIHFGGFLTEIPTLKTIKKKTYTHRKILFKSNQIWIKITLFRLI